MAHKRDHQRKKVYDSENAVFSKATPDYASLAECRAYMDQIIASEYWKLHDGWKRVGLLDGRGGSSAMYVSRKKSLALPKWSRIKWVIIHEMAHCLTHRTTKDFCAHGSHFAGHYLALVREMLGDTHYVALKESMDKHNVMYYMHNKQERAS